VYGYTVPIHRSFFQKRLQNGCDPQRLCDLKGSGLSHFLKLQDQAFHVRPIHNNLEMLPPLALTFLILSKKTEWHRHTPSRGIRLEVFAIAILLMLGLLAFGRAIQKHLAIPRASANRLNRLRLQPSSKKQFHSIKSTQIQSCKRRFSFARASIFSHRKALALILVKVECRNGRSLSCVPIRGPHGAEMMSTLAQDRYPP
jgi:hypothetical protein